MNEELGATYSVTEKDYNPFVLQPNEKKIIELKYVDYSTYVEILREKSESESRFYVHSAIEYLDYKGKKIFSYNLIGTIFANLKSDVLTCFPEDERMKLKKSSSCDY